MERAPKFPIKGKKVKASDFTRRYHCRHYKTCMNEAAKKDLHLDCGACEYQLKDVKEI